MCLDDVQETLNKQVTAGIFRPEVYIFWFSCDFSGGGTHSWERVTDEKSTLDSRAISPTSSRIEALEVISTNTGCFPSALNNGHKGHI